MFQVFQKPLGCEMDGNVDMDETEIRHSDIKGPAGRRDRFPSSRWVRRLVGPELLVATLQQYFFPWGALIWVWGRPTYQSSDAFRTINRSIGGHLPTGPSVLAPQQNNHCLIVY